MKDERKLLTEQTDLLLQVLNHQRHDWLNHFQVLLGYLKLGRPEQGEEYLKRVTALVCQESMIARINCPPLSVFFLTFNAIHHDLLLEVEVCDQMDLSTLAMDTQEFFRFVTNLVFLIKEHQRPGAHNANSLLISMANEEGLIQIRFDLAGTLLASGNEEVEKLLERSGRLAPIVTEWSRTEDEWLLAMNFPCRT
ncbi:sporulation protein [Brevibacillus sp. SYP-B805]|uniref:Spo0B domain-containing protein n=1 Tax=Brevibacillus sp. SYP-B805 TaxID=1578199 RepID=UPI0013EA59B0|nr:Spo0B domain-containing protein [Brevibacillus sp. SYP-B805]NGQ94296.1 sporulation protein [Brevibacillus sp. SYP-B805]